ncbi:sugar ABC transporter ATP-binding protein [Trinickia mobilis]|uniref:sugar ABC transporter ATP-binding protein n=1 Tax=Trinickia mobilis TaxID=2816356 RepID=UPI001A8D5BFB|nr:sugar ABC transporter ATP-binding protein [Trinickia mobilis]
MMDTDAPQRAGRPAPIEILRAEHVTKLFGPVRALKDGSLTLRAGEVHALVGVNGAGKSTLSRIVSGHLRRSEGVLRYKGEDVDFAIPRDAMRAGISLVLQETSIAPDLSVMENLCLTHFGQRERLDWKALRRKAEAVLEELRQAEHLPLHKRAGDLSMAQRQIIEIGRALQQDSDLIILDEPTASFSPTEVESLFEVMRLLRSRGKALAFVSHRLEEIFEITDYVTVMRDGRTVEGDVATKNLTPASLIQMMVGREIENLYERGSAPAQARVRDEPLLEVSRLASGAMVRDVSFTLHPGEILGLAGLVGAGRSETIETIFGLRKRDAGTVKLNGAPFAASSPRDAIARGVGLIGEDRRRQGIVPDFSVTENLLLAHLGRDPGMHRHYDRHFAEIDRLMTELDMPDHILTAPMLGLSGGQQQKVIFARWLLLNPSVLLLDEPTRGVDIGTRNTIYQIIRKIAAKGIGVLVVSSDFEEVLGLSDRVVVLSDGVSVAQAQSELLDAEILAMYSAPRSSAQGVHDALAELSAQCGATSYWLQVERERVFCFDLVTHSSAHVGIAAERFPLISETSIPEALKTQKPGAVIADGALQSVLFRLVNQSGHSFGYVGVTAPSSASLDPEAIRNMMTSNLTRHGVGQLLVQTQAVETVA